MSWPYAEAEKEYESKKPAHLRQGYVPPKEEQTQQDPKPTAGEAATRASSRNR
jgi:hypothetical protein